jgi:hypothetical protein
MDCNICYETYDMESIVWLNCLHNLCKNCYNRLTQPLCPYCRFNIPKNNNILSEPEQPVLSASAPTPIIQIPRDWEQNTRIERRRRQRQREIERYSRRNTRRIPIQNNTQEITEEIPIQNIQNIQNDEINDEYIFNFEESIDDNNLQKLKNTKNNRWNHLNNQRSRYTNR